MAQARIGASSVAPTGKPTEMPKLLPCHTQNTAIAPSTTSEASPASGQTSLLRTAPPNPAAADGVSQAVSRQ